jgi:hypothetical protein
MATEFTVTIEDILEHDSNTHQTTNESTTPTISDVGNEVNNTPRVVEFAAQEEDHIMLLNYETSYDMVALKLVNGLGMSGNAVDLAKHMTPIALATRFNTKINEDTLAVYNSDELMAMATASTQLLGPIIDYIKPIFVAEYAYLCSVSIVDDNNTLNWPWYLLGNSDQDLTIKTAINTLPAHIQALCSGEAGVRSTNPLTINTVIAYLSAELRAESIWVVPIIADDSIGVIKNYFVIRNIRWTNKSSVVPDMTDDMERVVDLLMRG